MLFGRASIERVTFDAAYFGGQLSSWYYMHLKVGVHSRDELRGVLEEIASQRLGS